MSQVSAIRFENDSLLPENGFSHILDLNLEVRFSGVDQVFLRARGEGVDERWETKKLPTVLTPTLPWGETGQRRSSITSEGGRTLINQASQGEKRSREAWGQATRGQQGEWGTSHGRSFGRTRQHGWCSRCSSRCSSRYFSGHSPNYSQRRDAGPVGWRPLQAHAALRSVGSPRRLSGIAPRVARQSGGGAYTGRPEE